MNPEDVDRPSDGGVVGAGANEAKPEEIQRDVASLRGELDGLVSELDRRRHAAFDVRVQLKRHALPLAMGAGAILVALIVRGALRNRRRKDWRWQISSLARAVAQIAAEPDLTAYTPAVEKRWSGRGLAGEVLANGAGFVARTAVRAAI